MDLYIHLKIMTIPRPYKMTMNILFFALFLHRFLCLAAKCRTYELDFGLDNCTENDGGTSQRQSGGECIFSCNIDRTVCASASWYATWVVISSGTQSVLGFASYTSSSTSGATFTALWTNATDTRPRLTTTDLRLNNKTGQVHLSPSCTSGGYSIECHMTVCRVSATPFPPTVPHPPTLLRSSATIQKLSNPIISLLIMTIISVLYAILLS
ncbi:m16 protein [Murine cytomegalovirus (strain K181)]|uniref:M16 protein n=2 Tax=Muromegalovirus muridbeta1 TaxID=3050323 RepID=A8E1E7_MUHVK|nr:m16 protein [Murine cytomegalovirus (strain K181)]